MPSTIDECGSMVSGRLFLVALGLVIVLVGGTVVLVIDQGRTGGVTQTTNSGGPSGNVLMSLGPAPRILGPGITMNYTLTLIPGAGADGPAVLSVQEPKGLSVHVDQTVLTLSGVDIAVDVGVSAPSSAAPGEYNVGFRVAWSTGSTNLTYHFTVVQHLVLLLGGSNGPGPFDPGTLSVHPGESITWLSLDAGSDEYGGLRSVHVAEANATSPTLTLFSKWSYTFLSAGTFHIEDTLNKVLVADEIVQVA